MDLMLAEIVESATATKIWATEAQCGLRSSRKISMWLQQGRKEPCIHLKQKSCASLAAWSSVLSAQATENPDLEHVLPLDLINKLRAGP